MIVNGVVTEYPVEGLVSAVVHATLCARVGHNSPVLVNTALAVVSVMVAVYSAYSTPCPANWLMVAACMVASRSPVSVPPGQGPAQANVRVSKIVAVDVTENGP